MTADVWWLLLKSMASSVVLFLLNYTLLCLQVWWMPTGPEVVCLATKG